MGTAASLQIKRLAVHFVAEVIRLSRGVLNKMFRVTTRLDQARDAINVIQRVLSELAWRELGRRELSEDQVKALGGISDDLRALSAFARVCAAIPDV